MSSARKHIQKVAHSKGAALVAYVMGGDQPLGELKAVCETLSRCGVDAIEIGLPFSDPIADGPVIQAAAQRALDSGVNPQDVIQQASGIEAVPRIAMGYCNTAQRQGWDRFASELAGAGFSAAILCDLIPEEADEWCRAAEQHGIETIFLVAPTSTEERIRLAAEKCTGFLYAVGRTGVTGGAISDQSEARNLVERARNVTDLPIGVGFGISTPEVAAEVAEFADAVIVGSTIVNLLHNCWGKSDREQQIDEYLRSISAAVHMVHRDG